MNVRRLALGFLACALGMFALLGVAACNRPSGGTPAAESELQTLAAKQVQNYKGEKLGSITDFRENSIKGPQDVDIKTYRLSVGGNVKTPLSLTYDQVLSLPKYRKVVTLNCVEGWSVKVLWEGVKLTDILKKAGYDPTSKVVIFKAVDGYSSSLPLDYVQANDILLAYKMNDVQLPKARGFPFQVVAEDRWGYKWVKWVDAIDATNNTNFRGYWEQRGYDNKALVPGATK